MTGLENAQHDLSDAQFSLETAIELLDSIGHDDGVQLGELISHLRSIKTELAETNSQLLELQSKSSH